MPRLNVLILHRMGDPRFRREAVRSLEYMIPECRPDLNCIVHDQDLPFPEYLKEIEYDLIVLGPTFLCNRHDYKNLQRAKVELEFIKESSACKIALPQDDYDGSDILDDWMVDWNIDRVYTVAPEYWELLYPKYSRTGEIVLGYTGYITDKWIEAWKNPKKHLLRSIDISYRTHNVSANRCYLRNLKYVIADRFRDSIIANNYNLTIDISNDIRDMVPGEKWHEFIEDSKFCLTTPSGSSLIDPRNEIRDCVNRLIEKQPNISFKNVENSCFPGIDRLNVISAISPRNIEAALAETVQIATPGSYSNLMKPSEHFIPLNEDCSNIKDVVEMMKDPVLVASIQKLCKESIMDEKRLRRTVIVDEIIEYTRSVISSRKLNRGNQDHIDRLSSMYREEIDEVSDRFWRKRRIQERVRNIATKFGARRIKKYLLASASQRCNR